MDCNKLKSFVIAKFTSLKSRFALQVVRKTTPRNMVFTGTFSMQSKENISIIDPYTSGGRAF